MKGICAGVGAFLALASASHAEDAFHCPKPGTVVTYDNTGGAVVYGGQTGLVCQGRNGNVDYSNLLGIIPPLFAPEEAELQKLLPLKVGNEVEYTTKMDSSHMIGEAVTSSSMFYMRHTVKVARAESLATAAGTFDTLVIEHRMLSLGHGLGAWLYTYWVAPDLGFPVKIRYETRGGTGPDRVFEATSIRQP
jgi:hypothetical protein